MDLEQISLEQYTYKYPEVSPFSMFARDIINCLYTQLFCFCLTGKHIAFPWPKLLYMREYQ